MAVAGGVLAVVLFFVYRLPLMTQQYVIVVPALAALVSIAIARFFARGYVCPRCGAKLLQLFRRDGHRFDKRLFTDVWDKCPQCALSFDDPWPG
jgi:hypothetical protein